MGGWDWHSIWSNVEKMGLAYLITIPLGWEREREAHSAGIRTFPIVGMACCGLMLVAQDDSTGLSRVLQGLITGVGFVGGGAILKDGSNVRGTATAASILNTAVIGAAVGLGKYEIAVTLAILNLVTLHWLIPLKKKMGGSDNE